MSSLRMPKSTETWWNAFKSSGILSTESRRLAEAIMTGDPWELGRAIGS